MIFFIFVSATLWVIWRIYSFFAYRRRSYDGKTILITGATSEVGRRLCFRFYGLNARIIAWDSTRSRLDELQRDVVGYYSTVVEAVPDDSASSSSSPTTTTTTATTTAGDATAPAGRGSTGSSKVPPIAGFSRVAATSSTSSATATTTVKENETFIVQSVDLGARLTIQRMAKELLAAGIVPDVILHAAHSCPSKSFLERPDDAMEKVVFVNTLTPLWIAKVFLPSMLEKRASCQIVNFVTSAGDQCTRPYDAPEYVASQWGAVGAHYALRRWVQAQRKAWAGVPVAAPSPSSTTSSVSSSSASTLARVNAVIGSATSTAATPGSAQPAATTPLGSPASDIRVCLVSLRDIQATTTSLFSIPYADERGLAREETVASPRRASSVPSGALSARGPGGAGASAGAGGSADANLSPSQIGRREAKRMDGVVDRAIRAIMQGAERYSDRSLSNWYAALEVLPVPWYAKLIQWFDK